MNQKVEFPFIKTIGFTHICTCHGHSASKLYESKYNTKICVNKGSKKLLTFNSNVKKLKQNLLVHLKWLIKNSSICDVICTQ